MADEKSTQPAKLENPLVRFEPTDAGFGWIFAIILGAGVLAAGIQLGVLGFFEKLRHDAEDKTHNPFATARSRWMPPEPRLEQVDRLAGIEAGSLKLEQMAAKLNRYGRAAEKGHVHIPIGRAMDYLADKLPVRATQPTPAQKKRQNGLVDAGESNSGRVFREVPRE